MLRDMVETFAGVDTHRDTHTAAVVDMLGRVLATATFAVGAGGYRELADWIGSFGRVTMVGVEGTGSYGAGLTRHLLSRGWDVREVTRPNRQHRRRYGKSDPADAVAAARAVANGDAAGMPRCVTGPVEATRNLNVVRKGLVKTQTATANQIKALVVTAPQQLRQQLAGCTYRQMAAIVAELPTSDLTDPAHAVAKALRMLTQLWIDLAGQIRQLENDLEVTVTAAAPPALLDEVGIGTIGAADLICCAGANPHRFAQESSYAAATGTSPVDASSGQHVRHRLNRGGDRQANAALYRAVIVRLRYHQPTRDYMQRRLAEGKTKKEVIRCLKRYIARRVWRILTTQPT